MQCKHQWKFKNLRWSRKKKKLKQLIHLANTWRESCSGDRKASKDLAVLAFGCDSYLTETQMTQLESDLAAARKLCSSRDQLTLETGGTGKQISVQKSHCRGKGEELETHYFVHLSSELLRNTYFTLNFVNLSFSCYLSLNTIYTLSVGGRNATKFHVCRDNRLKKVVISINLGDGWRYRQCMCKSFHIHFVFQK